MCYSFSDKMDHEQVDPINTHYEAATKAASGDSSEILRAKKEAGGTGSKRTASESLEQGVKKVAKLTPNDNKDIDPGNEAAASLDPRDEEILKLKADLKKVRKEKAEIEKDLEKVEEERDEHNIRVHELEARESKRIEKEKICATDMHSTMKLAQKNLLGQLKTDFQKYKKDLKESYQERFEKLKDDKDRGLADQKARYVEQLKKFDDLWKKKHSELQDKFKKAEAEHKADVKQLKEDHKKEEKNLKPEHSQAMKEKTKDLKAKQKEIDELKSQVEAQNDIMKEKEDLADQLEKSKAKQKKLKEQIEEAKASKAEMEGQYNKKLEHEGQRWQLQHNKAEDFGTRLMIQQRSHFALRAECDAKGNQIRALQDQLQTAQTPAQHSTADASVQTSIDTDDTDPTAAASEDAGAPSAYVSSISPPSAIDSPLTDYTETESGLKPVE